MCGILGFVSAGGVLPPVASVRQAIQDLHHRGPDDCGLAAFDPATLEPSWFPAPSQLSGPVSLLLGATRLAILDLSRAAHQPFASDDGHLVLVYNGEIYNYRELRLELEAGGAKFRTTGDTEVVMKAFEAWGEDCLGRFEGMFALAILDTRRRHLFLARDAFGIKPLYFTQSGGLFFASQLGALLSLSGTRRRIHAGALARYLETGWSDGDEATLVDGVSRLPAGCHATMDVDFPGSLRVTRYWHLPEGPDSDLSFGEAAARMRDLVVQSVERHLWSDAPVAMALSGGVDSSSIVAVARRLLGRNADLHTFTFAGSGRAETDEEPWARIASQGSGSTMHLVPYAPEALAEDFSKFVFLQDWPTSSPVIFAQRQVFAAAAAAGFKVLLGGQGPDEYLAGYSAYIPLRAASELRRGRIGAAARLVLRSENRAPSTRAQLAKATLGHVLDAPLRLIGHRKGRAEPISPGSNPFRVAVRRSLTERPLPGILRVEDANSMACSVESRVPLLTQSLVRFALGLPDSYLVSPDGATKAVLRAAMRGITPDAILDRKDKMGFPVPLDAWLRTMAPFCSSWVEEAAGLPCLDGGRVRETWRRFLARGEGAQGSWDAFLLWRWIFLAAWVRQFRVEFP